MPYTKIYATAGRTSSESDVASEAAAGADTGWSAKY